MNEEQFLQWTELPNTLPEIECIIGHRADNGSIQYHVRYANKEKYKCEIWEDNFNVCDAEKVRQYWENVDKGLPQNSPEEPTMKASISIPEPPPLEKTASSTPAKARKLVIPRPLIPKNPTDPNKTPALSTETKAPNSIPPSIDPNEVPVIVALRKESSQSDARVFDLHYEKSNVNISMGIEEVSKKYPLLFKDYFEKAVLKMTRNMN